MANQILDRAADAVTFEVNNRLKLTGLAPRSFEASSRCSRPGNLA
jgi:hypothetical protein